MHKHIELFGKDRDQTSAFCFLTFTWMSLAVCFLSSAGFGADSDVLTFLGWSDQHVKTGGDGSHLIPAIEAMNKYRGINFVQLPSPLAGSPNEVTGHTY